MKSLKAFMAETAEHKVFVRDYGNGLDINDGKSDLGHKDFHAMVKTHQAEHDFSADKGESFRFKHEHHAQAFQRAVNVRFKNLSAETDRY